MEDLYKQYQKMVCRVAHNTAEKYPRMQVEELICEGNYIFLKTVESYQEDKAAFSTWLYRKLRLDLNNFAARQTHKRKREAGEMTVEPADRQAGIADHAEILAQFSEDAREVVSIALTAPEDLSRGLLREILKDMGWASRRIRGAFAEIRTVL